MRGLKNSIILLVIIIILIGILLIYKGNIRRSSTISLLPKDANISEILVDSIDVVKENNVWMMRSPIHYKVAQNKIKSTLMKLKELELGDYVIVDSLYYSEYGFTNESKKVFIYFDNDSVKFLVGKPAAVPDAFFLRKIGDRGIYTGYGFSPYILSNKSFDWRDKSIAFLPKDKIDSLSCYKYRRLIFKGTKEDSGFSKIINQIYRAKVYEFPDTTGEKLVYKVILYGSGKTNSFSISRQIGSYYIVRNDSTIFKLYSHYIIHLLNIIQSK